MATLVSIQTDSSTLSRYETGGSAIRLTHRCSVGRAVDIAPQVIRNFRISPPDEFAVDPPPRPTNPPAGAGTIRQAA